ncbi:phytanoyl-CoA dioxygenase [Hesseltinella vesiculosa]|uniref:Phytanoyl-CoA dioxygenase n=1 Tax=Hesseltinella vesiculosa TaxID=101127 RepID=A0A1X2GWH3_9FUNG|nr:phytanoyl-CoA dioxygenase [Hesseltinella vesiculosa]
MLSQEQLQKFDRDGFLAIPNFFTQEQAIQLKQRADQLLQQLDLNGHPMTQFSTGETNDHVGDDYFLTSGDKVRYFFEEGAFNDRGELTVPKERAINKVGHGLHMLDPVFAGFTLNDKMASLAHQIGFQSPRVLQSMIICKQPSIGGKVPSHQDSSFLYTDPLSARGFWFALEDCTPTNGALSFIPGSHKDVPVTKRFVRAPVGGTTFIGHDSPFDETKYVEVPVTRGTLVLIHGSVVHRSTPNLSDVSRFIYTFHVIEGNAKYAEDNW